MKNFRRGKAKPVSHFLMHVGYSTKDGENTINLYEKSLGDLKIWLVEELFYEPTQSLFVHKIVGHKSRVIHDFFCTPRHILYTQLTRSEASNICSQLSNEGWQLVRSFWRINVSSLVTEKKTYLYKQEWRCRCSSSVFYTLCKSSRVNLSRYITHHPHQFAHRVGSCTIELSQLLHHIWSRHHDMS